MKSKNRVSKWIFFYAVVARALVAQDALNNEEIVRLVRAQMSDDVILRLIAAKAGSYSTSPEALIELRHAGVSDQVVLAMLDRSSLMPSQQKPTASTSVTVKSSALTTTSRESTDQARPESHATNQTFDESNRSTNQANSNLSRPEFLEDGTIVRLRLLKTLSSAVSRVGDEVRLEVLDDVSVGSRLVIPQGARVEGVVVDAQSKRRFGIGGTLALNVEWVRLPDGSRIALRVNRPSLNSNSNEMAVKAPVKWLAVPFVIAKGREALLPRGTEINACIDGDVSIGTPYLSGRSLPRMR